MGTTKIKGVNYGSSLSAGMDTKSLMKDLGILMTAKHRFMMEIQALVSVIVEGSSRMVVIALALWLILVGLDVCFGQKI
ncbi:hypothetical protein HYC85_023060 [Camellia sinensis]|uniref:Uncharacterized protein n=1 Tax=Camellia sinensis TaxID=4442 RepID=A0A7J7GFT2_CAMSI|nr:hypothetical protein HYC85_023060 [Camellia sinensis]